MENKNTEHNEREEKFFRESMEAEERRRAASVRADMQNPDEEESYMRDAAEITPEDSENARRKRALAEADLRAAKQARQEAEMERERARYERRMAQRDYRAARGDRSDRSRNERIGRKMRDDDEEEYRKEYYGDRYVSEGRGERWRKGRKKTGAAAKFFRVLLVILLIGVLLIGILYLRIHGGGSDFLSRVKEAVSGESKSNSNMDNYTNIALFGVDSISQSLSSGNNRSDVNIILSINNSTKECRLVSVYRDTYLDIGSATYTKCNAAYAYGGPAQAVAMLNQNFDLAIEDYVTIGFGGIADIIDAVGGVEIDVQQEEISFMNDYQSTMASELGKTYVPVTTAGTQTLNGLQATAYCRIRYTDGGDYHRTERQREVLTKTFSKLKSASPTTDAGIVMTLIGNKEIETSLSPTEIMTLASDMSGADVSDTAGVPTEEYRVEAYVGDQACIIPYTLEQNVVWLHQYLFSESNYEVSDTVQAISDQIQQNTGY